MTEIPEVTDHDTQIAPCQQIESACQQLVRDFYHEDSRMLLDVPHIVVTGASWTYYDVWKRGVGYQERAAIVWIDCCKLSNYTSIVSILADKDTTAFRLAH
jgi:hypothetical protein